MIPTERLCKVHSLEFGTFELKPGGSLRVGRHQDNDIVAKDTMVSRFHARITWEQKLERPVVFDNGSQNGTIVDGETVRTAEPLRDGVKITIGPFVFRVELIGCGETPAVLKDTNDMVTLFSEDGPDLTGKLTPQETIRLLTQRLESERRTGTLKLDFDDSRKARIVYCLGRVMTCEISGDGTGLRALERILLAKKGSFTFSRELEPQEEALNLWVSDFLRSRNLDPGDSTQRFRQP